MISAFLPKSLRRWNAGVAVFAALFVAACTCTTGGGFRITKPTAGEHLPPGDVVVCMTPVPGDYCYFPPKAYEVTLDGRQSRMVVADANPLCTTFNGVGPGPHVADAWVMRHDKRAETASVKFIVDAPPPPPTPVLIVSAYISDPDGPEDRVLSKPFSIADLTNCVRDLLTAAA